VDKLVELLHEMIDLLPWRTEAAKLAAHEKTETVAEAAAPVGRNTTPSGVVTGEYPPSDKNTGSETSTSGGTEGAGV